MKPWCIIVEPNVVNFLPHLYFSMGKLWYCYTESSSLFSTACPMLMNPTYQEHAIETERFPEALYLPNCLAAESVVWVAYDVEDEWYENFEVLFPMVLITSIFTL